MYDTDCPWLITGQVESFRRCGISNYCIDCQGEDCPIVKNDTKQKFRTVRVVLKVISLIDKLRSFEDRIGESNDTTEKRLDILENRIQQLEQKECNCDQV